MNDLLNLLSREAISVLPCRYCDKVRHWQDILAEAHVLVRHQEVDDWFRQARNLCHLLEQEWHLRI